MTPDEAAWCRRVWPSGVAWQRDDGPALWVPGHPLTTVVLMLAGPLELYPLTGGTLREEDFGLIVNDDQTPPADPTRGRLADRNWYRVCSAGTAAGPNDRPTPEAVDVLLQWSVDHRDHRSTPAGAELIARADDIIAMTRAHLLAVLGRFPVVPGSMRLLCGADGDLDDPIGGGPGVYQECAGTIRRHVNRLISEMGLT